MKRKIFSIFILISLFLISSKVSAQGILEIEIPKGSCLSGIAIEYQTNILTLLRLNPQIKNPDLIFAEDILKVPASTTKIVILPGDTLSQLAKKYNTTVDILLALNPQIKDPDLIFAGDELLVPKSIPVSPTLPPSPPEIIVPHKIIPTLFVSLSANPSFGNAPLTGVDLTANVSGTATGTINYTFYCNRADESTEIYSGWCKRIENTTETSYTAIDCCNFEEEGVYTAKVIVERGKLKAEARVNITVEALSPLPTLSVSLSASPSSGFAPLTGVDLTANVSGTATGTINYTFYCDRSDESTEITEGWCRKVEEIAETTYTAVNCCSYSEAGLYSAKVIVERGSLQAEAKIEINVETPPISQPSHPSPPPSSPSQPPSCQDQYAPGERVYSGRTKTVPIIYQIVINPLDVEYLASQIVKVSIKDTNGNSITSVSGTAITDNKTVNFNLSLISGSETNGVWQGSWILQDSICQNYQVVIQATSDSGTSKVTLSFR